MAAEPANTASTPKSVLDIELPRRHAEASPWRLLGTRLLYQSTAASLRGCPKRWSDRHVRSISKRRRWLAL
eukprot:7402131-Prorocentrum_lima.AAC.1